MGQRFSMSKRTLKRGSNCSQEILSCLFFDCFHLISGQCIDFWEQKILIRESKSLCENIFFSPLLSRVSFFFISGGCSHITLPNMLKYMILRAVLFHYECVCVCVFWGSRERKDCPRLWCHMSQWLDLSAGWVHNSHVPRRTNGKLVKGSQAWSFKRSVFSRRGDFKVNHLHKHFCNHPNSETNNVRFLVPREYSVLKVK